MFCFQFYTNLSPIAWILPVKLVSKYGVFTKTRGFRGVVIILFNPLMHNFPKWSDTL